MKQTVRAFAPATVANAISGFDVLGFAMEKPGDIVTCTLSNKAGIRISVLHQIVLVSIYVPDTASKINRIEV